MYSTNEDILKEVSRREKQSGIVPEPDIDTYMKVINLQEIVIKLALSRSWIPFPLEPSLTIICVNRQFLLED